MESNSDYVNNFLKSVDNFVANIRSDDPLPVRAPSYKITETEIDGQIIDIVYHYLNHRECPAYLRSVVAHRVWVAIRNPQDNGKEEDEGCDVLDHGNHTYEPVKLIQDVTSRANAIVRELQKTLSPSVIESLPRYLPVSQYAIKNTRRKMEDRHMLIQDLNTLYDLDVRSYGHPHAYYGVFDGHAGSDAAIYSAALLHQYLIQNPFYETDPVKALKHAFYITDTNFAKKTEKERLKGGTTAVVALVREKRLVVAWLGDSLALLVRKRTPVHIVEPHKPEAPSEQKRIEDAGGTVHNIHGTWRVLGQLAVSRAIGDVQYKPFVTSECDIKSLEICGDEDFLILACDGLWDNLSPERAVSIVFSYLLNNEGDTDGVGRCLVEAARSSGSEDNITTVVVFLRPVSVLMEEERARIEEGQVPEMDSFVVTQKNALPPSFNAIFKPPEHFNNASPSPSSEDTVSADTNGHPPLSPPKEPSPIPIPVEGLGAVHPPPDYDSDDEGVGADITVEKGMGSPEDMEENFTEEVDAALAEIDSIPDGGCEVEEADDDQDEEDEEWTFSYKMEPLKRAQDDDYIDSESSEIRVHTLPVGTTDVCEVPPPETESSSFVKERSPSSSPTAPGSPRTVEGFVTSVELNTPEESYNTNLAINQSTEYFNSGHIEQSSGPFSVYVSSSPEPASIETPPVNLHASMPSSAAYPEEEQTECKDVKEVIEESSSTEGTSVEIVHAQSTVEVVDTEMEEEIGETTQIPDLMSQSFTGELPSEPLVSSIETLQQHQQPSPILEDVANFIEESKSHALEDLDLFDHQMRMETETSEQMFTEQYQTIQENVSATTTSQVEEVTESVNELLMEPPPSVPVEVEDFVSNEDPQTLFNHEVNRAFDAPLDQMIASFHEDRTQLSDLIGGPSDIVTMAETMVAEEVPTADLLNGSEDTVQEIVQKVSEIQICHESVDSEETVVTSSIPTTSASSVTSTSTKKPATPASVPRTSLSKPTPPKPSPRSGGIKTTTSRLSTEPSPASKVSLRRPTSLSTTSTTKTLTKPETGKSPMAATKTTTKSRLSTSTTSPSSALLPTRRTTAAKQPVGGTTGALSKTRTPTTFRATTTCPAPKTQVASSSAPKSSASSLKRKVTSTTTTSTATASATQRRLTSANKSSASTTKVSTTTTTSKSNVAASVASRTNVSKSTTTTATRKPLITRTTTSTTTRMTSATAPRKPLSSATKTIPNTTSTLKQRNVSSAPAPTKDTKNTTNRILSTTSRTSTAAKPTLTSRTTATTKTRSTNLRTTKSPGLRTEKGAAAKSPMKAKIEENAVANGENKIVEEESSVEVKEKVLEEATMVVQGETISSVVDDIVTKQDKIFVNGDHP